MNEDVSNLARLTCSIVDSSTVVAAKGAYLECYNITASGGIAVRHRFRGFSNCDGEVTQIVSTPDYLFLSCGRFLARVLRSQVLEPEDNTITSEEFNLRHRIACLHPFKENGLLVVFANSTICVLDAFSPKTVLHSWRPAKIVEIMGARCWGESFENCKVLMFTYLGSMLQFCPASSRLAATEFDGTPGMVFDAVITPCQRWAITVHDDRSVRIWDLNATGRSLSIAASFAHKARPFSVCQLGNTIYTGSNDKTIIRWHWNEATHELFIEGEVFLAVGTIRALRILSSQLLVCADSGFLASVPLEAFRRRRLEVSNVTEPSLNFSARSCYVTRTHEYVIDEKGTLSWLDQARHACMRIAVKTPIRYFASPCGFEPATKNVAVAWSDRIVVLLDGDHSSGEVAPDANAVFVSVVRCGDRILAATSLDTIISFDCSRGTINKGAVFCTRSGRRSIAKKNPFVVNSAVCCRTGSKTHYVFGCASGHLLRATFVDEMETCRTPCKCDVLAGESRLFAGDAIQDLWIEEGHLYALGKCGYMIIFRFDVHSDDLSLNLIQKSSVGMDWPCRFIEFSNGKRYIIGFHSTKSVLFDLALRIPVWSAECGGGNRHWQFHIDDGDLAELRCIRDERVCVISSKICSPCVLDRPLHVGKILFLAQLSGAVEEFFVSAGADNRIVLSRIRNGVFEVLWERFESEGFVSGSIQRVGDDRWIFICGLAKARVLILEVDLNQKDAIGGFSPSVLNPLQYVSGANLNVFGRLQIGASVSNGEFSENVAFAIADDASDRAICAMFADSRSEILCEVSSNDRAGFSKVTLCGGFLLGASTNGYLYVASKGMKGQTQKRVSACGLSALSTLPSIGSNASIIVALGDEAGSLHLVRVYVDGEAVKIDAVASLESVHAGIVTDVKVVARSPSTLHLISTSLDCRIVVSEWSGDQFTVIGRDESLVQDPSGLCVLDTDEKRTRVLVYGYGCETRSVVHVVK